jgi:hypothetical protein
VAASQDETAGIEKLRINTENTEGGAQRPPRKNLMARLGGDEEPDSLALSG